MVQQNQCGSLDFEVTSPDVIEACRQRESRSYYCKATKKLCVFAAEKSPLFQGSSSFLYATFSFTSVTLITSVFRTRGLSFMESLQLNQALGAQSPLLSVPVEMSGSDGFMVPLDTLSQLMPNSKYAAVHNGARVGIVMTHGRFGTARDSPSAAIQAQIILDNEGSVESDASQGSQATAADAEQTQEPATSKRKTRRYVLR